MQSLPVDSSQRRARGVVTSLLVALGLLLLAFAADSMVTSLATAAISPERVTLSGSDVAIFNLAGKARLEAGSGTAVQATVTLAGRDAGDLQLETNEIRGRKTLVVAYPGKRIVYPEMGQGSNTSVRVREDGTFDGNWGLDWAGGWETVRIAGSGSGVEAHADLVVSVPRSQKLSLYLAAGEVTVTNVDGVLRVDTGSGDVEVTGIKARKLSIDTGSGSVEITLASACEEIIVDTGSGNVSVNVPQGFGADISFESGSGDFETDLPVTVREREHGSFRGRVGNGAARLVVDTGSGDLRLVANPGR